MSRPIHLTRGADLETTLRTSLAGTSSHLLQRTEMYADHVCRFTSNIMDLFQKDSFYMPLINYPILFILADCEFDLNKHLLIYIGVSITVSVDYEISVSVHQYK